MNEQDPLRRWKASVASRMAPEDFAERLELPVRPPWARAAAHPLVRAAVWTVAVLVLGARVASVLTFFLFG